MRDLQSSASTSSGQRERHGEALLRSLQGLVTAHGRLLEFADEREQALRMCDTERLALVIQRENAVIGEVARLDRQRCEAVEALAPAEEAPALTIHDVAPALPGRLRERVLAVAATLRQRIEALHEKNAALQAAAEALARHAQGLVREATSRLNHSGSYSDRGVVDPGPPVLSTVDITT